MAQGKALMTSHALVFFAGFALGKYVDHEELMTYREAHESFGGRWRRRAGNVAIGVFALGTIGMVARLTSRGGAAGSPATIA